MKNVVSSPEWKSWLTKFSLPLAISSMIIVGSTATILKTSVSRTGPPSASVQEESNFVDSPHGDQGLYRQFRQMMPQSEVFLEVNWPAFASENQVELYNSANT